MGGGGVQTTVAIEYFEVYGTPNMGLFLKANDRNVFIPNGMAPTKVEKLAKLLDVQPIQISIARTRLIGPLMALNNHGILLPRTAWPDEIQRIKSLTDIRVEVLPTKYTCLGNLILANNKGAIVSKLLTEDNRRLIRDVLDVEVVTGQIAGYHQVGATAVATDHGSVVHPAASEEEIKMIQEVLKVRVEPCTVNSGVPFVSSGLIANNKRAIVGFLTTGPELAIITRAFSL
jgi:translation initiation factor 6